MEARAAEGWVTVGFATGNETFIELGSETNNPPQAGEVIFYDERGQALARRWCWRQSAESAVRADTRQVLIVIEAQHEGGKNAVRAAQGDLINLLNIYCGGDVLAGTVDLWRPKMPPR
jgi:DNA/RNA-binding domain of Phe-tRNA-synthetase-like protein